MQSKEEAEPYVKTDFPAPAEETVSMIEECRMYTFSRAKK
jgi:hypothetical protein